LYLKKGLQRNVSGIGLLDAGTPFAAGPLVSLLADVVFWWELVEDNIRHNRKDRST
jgi:hypothetical protein